MTADPNSKSSQQSPIVNQKDFLLSEIVRVEGALTNSKLEIFHKTDEKAKQEKINTELRRVFELARDAFNASTVQVNELDRSLRDQTRAKTHNAEQLEQLKRELARLLDAERINENYLRQVEAFKEACLNAPWRIENRNDNQGAKSYQIDGGIHLAVAGQAILGDPRGLGKSLTSLIYADLIGAKRVIIIGPSDTMDNFCAEVNMWTPHRSPIKIGKMNKGERDYLLPAMKMFPEYMLVLNYEAWRRDPSLITDLIALQADTIILDEAHRMKEVSSLACKGVMDIRFGGNICPGCDNPDIVLDEDHQDGECLNCNTLAMATEFCSIKYVLPMTGTPVLNKPQELFPLLHLIDPVLFPSVRDFLADFCMQRMSDRRWVWRFGAEKQLIKMIGPRYLARTRDMVKLEIPPIKPVTHLISMADLKADYPSQYKAYQQARNYAQLVLDPERSIAMSMPIKIVVLLRLRQILSWPAGIELKIPDEKNPELIKEVVNLDVHESVKADKTEEIIRETLEETADERIVVFSQSNPFLHEMKRRLGDDAVLYVGGMTEEHKREIQLDFDARTAPVDPRWKVILVGYKAGGEGLNFTGASTMIIPDREWNPGREGQAKGRIDRIGQTRNMTIHTIMVESSVDTWMDGIITAKGDMIAGFDNEQNVYQSAFTALQNGEM